MQYLSRRVPILIAFLLAAVAAGALSGCSRNAGKRVKVVVWGVQLSEETRIEAACIREFERRNPGIKISMLSMGAGSMNPQKLMTAIVGRTPPDLIYQDRFTIGDWAKIGRASCRERV